MSNIMYTKNGEVEDFVNTQDVMVQSQDDLEDLADNADVPPGSIAYTAGFLNIWQLSASGEWVDMLGTEE